MVVRNLGLSRAYYAYDGGFSYIGEAHKAHIGQHLQLQHESTLVALLAGLCIARSLVGGTLEVPVAQAAATALQQDEFLAVLGDLAHRFEVLLAILVLDQTACHRTQRHGDDNILGILARRAGTRAALTILGELVTLVLEVNQRPVLAVTHQHNRTSLAAVAAVRTSEGDKLLAAEVRRTSTAVSRTGEYLNVINEIGTCHNRSCLICKKIVVPLRV